MSSISTSSQAQRDSKQAGLVSIMVTMILLIIMSLIVLGFAQISRRNQRQALDRQLSTQAFYAAETGVNDVANIIKTNGTAPAKPTCSSSGGGVYVAPAFQPNIDAANNVSYSCVTVDPSPNTLAYTDIGTTSTIIPLTAETGTFTSVTLTWQSKDPTSTPTTNCPTTTGGVFVKAGSGAGTWSCGYGLLRIDLVPTSGGGLNIANLQASTMSSFFVPQRIGGSNVVGFATGGGNNLVGVQCNNTDCHLTVTGLSTSQYYMRVSSWYKDVSLQVSATNASGAVGILGAQAVVDSTGKAQDVLRRIQVRIPYAGSSKNLLSDMALESTEAICKRFSVMDGGGGNPGFYQSYVSAVAPGLSSSTSNPLCL